MSEPISNRPWALIILIALQLVCVAFFLADAIMDAAEIGGALVTNVHFLIESLATATLLIAAVLEWRVLRNILRRQFHLERQASLASAAFHDIVEDHFAQWGLTPAEKDVAHFAVKGLTISEIAQMRESAEGTVKSHLNNIYRKAEVPGRAAFLSLLIDDLMEIPSQPVTAPMTAAQ